MVTTPLHVPTVVIIGGPPIHAGYVKRLFKAEAAGKLTFDRIVIVDHDPKCAAAEVVGGRVSLDVSSWNDWLAANLSQCDPADQLVPYHWAPHVLLDWLAHDLRQEGLTLERADHQTEPPARPPVLRETKAGDLAMSYAEWLCPPACIEPALCPHTRGPKSWSLATELAAARASCVFPCMHLAYGVGTIPMDAIFRVRNSLREHVQPTGGAGEVWIGSASHCHGLTARCRISADGSRPS